MDKFQDQFKQVYAQLRDLYMSMTPGNRITATLLFFLLIASLGFLIVGGIKPGETKSKFEYVYPGHDFTPAEKVAVESALSKIGLNNHEWVGDQLRVPRGSVSTYTAQIAKEKAVKISGNTSFDMAEKLSPWDSKNSQREKMFQSKAQDAAAAIMRLDGILSASVIPNSRRDWDVRNNFIRKDVVTVGVTVEPVGFKPLDVGTVSAIGNLVAMIFGTEQKYISIVDSKNNRIYNGGGDEPGGATNYLRATAMEEDKWKNKIHDLLNIPGLQVATTVVLSREIKKYFDVEHRKPKAVLYEHVYGRDYKNTGAWRGGRPGHIAMMSRPLIDPEINAGQGFGITEKVHEAEKTNPLGGRETRGEEIPLTPESIFASLRIPMDYVKESWVLKNRTTETPNPEPTPDQIDEEKQLIEADTKRIVAKQLEPYKDPRKSDALDSVEVKFYEPPAKEAEPELTAWQQVLQWLKLHWQTLGLLGLVLCGMCVLWSIGKPAKPESIVIYEAPEIPMEVFEAQARAKAEAEAAEEAEDDEEAMARSLDGFDRSIRSLQDEIAELVEENPAAAAAVLRQWIGTVVSTEGK